MIKYNNWKIIIFVLCFFIVYGIISNYGIYFKKIDNIESVANFLKFGVSLNTSKGHFFGFLIIYLSIVHLNIEQSKNKQLLIRKTRFKYTVSQHMLITKVTLYFVLVFTLVHLLQLLLICEFTWLINNKIYLLLLPLFLILFTYYLISGIIFKLIYDLFDIEYMAWIMALAINVVLYTMFMFLEIETYIIKMTIVFNNFFQHLNYDLLVSQSLWVSIQHLSLACILIIINIAIYKKKDVLY